MVAKKIPLEKKTSLIAENKTYLNTPALQHLLGFSLCNTMIML